MQSQPDCVAHVRAGRSGGEQRRVQRGEVVMLRSADDDHHPARRAAAAGEVALRTDLPPTAAFDWLAPAGATRGRAGPSLAYGLIVLRAVGRDRRRAVVLGWDYILFPAFAGFLVFAPALAVGLYEKSRALEAGEPVDARRMIFAAPGVGRADPVHRRAAVRADAAVDARGDHHLRAVLRRAPVPRPRPCRADAVHHAEGLGDAARRQRGRRAVRGVLASRSPPSRSR